MDKKCDYCDELLAEWDYITNCGHSLCDSCYRLDMNKCLLCKKHCEYKLIGEKMSTSGTKFLSPISRVLNDAQEIVEFQMSSLLRLVSFLRDKVERQRLLLQQVKQELSTVKEFKWELHHLREENELLKTKLNKQLLNQKQEKQVEEKSESAKEGEESEEEELKEEGKEEDEELSLYYHPLKKEEFSSQQLSPFFFQSRANRISSQNLL